MLLLDVDRRAGLFWLLGWCGEKSKVRVGGIMKPVGGLRDARSPSRVRADGDERASSS